VGQSLRILKAEVGAIDQGDRAAARSIETAGGQVPLASESQRASG